jgi:hypothetical protein
MDKYFILTVAVGTIIIKGDGSRQTLSEVPKNALELWEEGSRTLCLRKEGVEILTDFSKERLEKVLETRIHLDYKAEIRLLEDLINTAGKVRKTDKPE